MLALALLSDPAAGDAETASPGASATRRRSRAALYTEGHPSPGLTSGSRPALQRGRSAFSSRNAASFPATRRAPSAVK
jgi:hypothetical protein